MSKRLLPVFAMFALVIGTASAAEQWHTYRDPAGAFTIRLPPGWKAHREWMDYGYGHYQDTPDDELGGTAFLSRRDLAPGTSLDTSGTYLVVQTLPAKTKCLADNFLVDPPPDYFTTEPDDTADFARTVAEPGNLDGYEQQVRVVSHSPCAAVHIFIGYSQSWKPKYDRARLLGLFDRITRTLVVKR